MQPTALSMTDFNVVLKFCSARFMLLSGNPGTETRSAVFIDGLVVQFRNGTEPPPIDKNRTPGFRSRISAQLYKFY